MSDIMGIKRNKYLQKSMKQCEIDPKYRTEALYLPSKKSLCDMTAQGLRRGLCCLADKDGSACRVCPAPCGIGQQYLAALTMPPPQPVIEKDETTLAERIRAAMQKQGVTQRLLADRLGVSQSRVSRMISGSRVIEPRTAQRICVALSIPYEA